MIILPEDEYLRLPQLFHLDNYHRCLTQKNGLYCLATYHITPPLQSHREYELIKVIDHINVLNYYFLNWQSAASSGIWTHKAQPNGGGEVIAQTITPIKLRIRNKKVIMPHNNNYKRNTALYKLYVTVVGHCWFSVAIHQVYKERPKDCNILWNLMLVYNY